MKKINFEVHEPLSEDLVQRMLSKFQICVARDELSETRLGDERMYFFEKYINSEDADFLFSRHLNYCKTIGINLPKYMMLMMNRTWFEPGSLGSGAGWHRDSGFRSQHKTFCYLSNVNQENGPFTISDHSNYYLSLLDNPRVRLKEDFQIKIKSKDVIYKEVTGGQGYSFSCCSNFIHRGMPVKSGERYMITVYAWNQLPPEPFTSHYLED